MKYIVSGVIIICGLGVFLYALILWNVYPASFQREETHDAALWLERADGAARQYFWVEQSGADEIILYLHGNGDTARRIYDWGGLSALPFDVMIMEYTGYGQNGGIPSERNLVRDISAAVAELRHTYPDRPVYIVASSLGGSAAIVAAPELKIAGLLTSAAFTRTSDFAPVWVKPLLRMSGSHFDAESAAPDVSVPWEITHCAGDPMTPSAWAERLFQSARSGPYGESVNLTIFPCAQHSVPVAFWAEVLEDLVAASQQ